MRWFLIAPVVLFAVGVLMYLFGLLRSRTHTSRIRAVYASAQDDVWAIVADHEHWAEWQPGIKRIEILPSEYGSITLIAEGTWGEIPMRIEALEPPRRMVTLLDGGTFSGRWTWELESGTEGGTVVTATEEGEVPNPFFRTTLIFHDNYKSLLATLTALGVRLGETVVPEKLD